MAMHAVGTSLARLVKPVPQARAAQLVRININCVALKRENNLKIDHNTYFTHKNMMVRLNSSSVLKHALDFG